MGANGAPAYQAGRSRGLTETRGMFGRYRTMAEASATVKELGDKLAGLTLKEAVELAPGTSRIWRVKER